MTKQITAQKVKTVAKTTAKPDKEKKPTGRPSVITDEMELEICEWITTGKGLVQWCKKTGHGYSSVMRALESKPAFRDRYARAHIDKADYLADEMITIADDGTNDSYTDDNGVERTNTDVIARSKLRVDTRKWIAAKLKPKKYGDQIDVTSDGQPIAPTQIIIQSVATKAKAQ